MKKIIKKLNIFTPIISIVIIAVIVITYSIPVLAIFGKTEKGGIYWLDKDNTFAVDGWKLIDEDNDGIGYYYYFNKNGFALIDDITPDYMIVDKDGKRIGFDGKPVAVKISELANDSMEEGVEESIYSADIAEQIKSQGNITSDNKGLVSSGNYLFNLETQEGPTPSDNLIIETNADGSAMTILGPNVDLNKKKAESYDTSIDKNMQTWVSGGSNYSKKTNGTIYTKSKWKDCMALKGTGATIIFDNPKNNFNKLKGRIATHYFSYTETTTRCTLGIYSDDTGEELATIDGFDYNGGIKFDCEFPRKTKKIRFELNVEGQYTSRVCYLRDCVYSFDKELYEDELYQDDVEAEYRRRVGTDSDADYVEEEEEEVNDSMGERSNEGIDPYTKYRLEHGGMTDDYWLTFTYDEDDDSITDAMKASISEAKARYEAEEEKRNKVSGPAFDKAIKDLKPDVGPNGQSNIFEGKSEGD